MMHIAGNAINKKLQKSLAPDGVGGMEQEGNNGSIAGISSNTGKFVTSEVR